MTARDRLRDDIAATVYERAARIARLVPWAEASLPIRAAYTEHADAVLAVVDQHVREEPMPYRPPSTFCDHNRRTCYDCGATFHA